MFFTPISEIKDSYPGISGNGLELLAGFSGDDRIALTLNFSQPVAAWGFYGFGFGTSEERNVYLEYQRADGSTGNAVVPYFNPLDTRELHYLVGGTLYFGLIATESPITRITILQSILSGDRLFLDNMAVSTSRVPEVSTLWLAAIGVGTCFSYSRVRAGSSSNLTRVTRGNAPK